MAESKIKEGIIIVAAICTIIGTIIVVEDYYDKKKSNLIYNNEQKKRDTIILKMSSLKSNKKPEIVLPAVFSKSLKDTENNISVNNKVDTEKERLKIENDRLKRNELLAIEKENANKNIKVVLKDTFGYKSEKMKSSNGNTSSSTNNNADLLRDIYAVRQRTGTDNIYSGVGGKAVELYSIKKEIFMGEKFTEGYGGVKFYSRYKHYKVKFSFKNEMYSVDNPCSYPLQRSNYTSFILKAGNYSFDIYHKNKLVHCCNSLHIKNNGCSVINVDH
ncbi:MAG: hypothetical protein WCO65_01475 [bacterium]